MVSAIDRKLLRDLTHLKGQVLTIALVVACGIASYVMMRSTYSSLVYSKDAYYERFRFGDVFASLKRAPEAMAARIEALPGVARAQTRVVERVMIPIADLPEPAGGKIVSLPEHGMPALNAIYLRSGTFPQHSDDVLVLQSFADAHGLEPGGRLPAVINGTRRELRISGTALSPEYVLAMSEGDITVDEKRFAVLWMRRSTLAPAYEMDGAFNDVSLKLQPGASLAAVLDRLDRLLEPYGGLGAVGRKKQLSNYALEGELSQLEVMATAMPLIFLGVAAFLLNVVLSRLVNLQRPEIATLKAVGYRDRDVALHYLKLVSVIVVVGAAAGVGVGAWIGREWTIFYGRFFKFPVLEYRLGADVVVSSVFISLAAALAGALGAARRVARLPPAEAMRPPPPATYRPMLLERLGLMALFGPAARMIVREVERRPLRTLLSSVGIAMAIAILVVARFWSDAVDYLTQVQFHRAMREDLNVTFIEPRPERAIRELAHIPGVLRAEGLRVVPVRMKNDGGYRDVPLWGYPRQTELRRLLDKNARETRLPDRGVLLTTKLAEILGVEPGDEVLVEIREGDRATRPLVVAGLIDESFGLQGHMRLEALDRFLREGPAVSVGLLQIDPEYYASVHARLKDMPEVAGVTRRDNLWERFQEQSGDMMLALTFVASLFAAIIAVGVVYNNARIALSMRSRDLASLRVLGFTRAEISAILLGELSIQLLLAIPLGLAAGTGLAHAMMATADPETYRFAVIISARTYAFASVIALGAGFVSALLVRRKLDRLDLIGVLKTRE